MAAFSSVGRRREWGMRTRSVAVAVTVVSVGLLLSGAVLVPVLASTLTAAATADLSARTDDIAQLIGGEELGESKAILSEDRRGGELIQLLDVSGRVVLSTDRRLTEPMSTLRPQPGSTEHEKVPTPPGLRGSEEFLIAARGLTIDNRPYILLVATPAEISRTVQTVGGLLLATTPFLVALAGLAAWVLVGRSLQTVDRIRRQVAEIDARRLDERVDVPGTGDEIAALAETMNTMLGRLQAADRSQRAFFSDASHELRSPLATLVTTAEVASGDPTGRTWVELQNTVLAETHRMQGLVEDLLTLAKVDSQSLQLAQEDVDLEDLLATELHRLDALTTLTVRATLCPARLTGDERRLSQVFRNLLDNAARHAHSCVEVRLAADQSTINVTVDNDGEPIPVADRQRVFERFVRLDDSRTSDRAGSGLGLAIVREIVAAHGGTVAVADTRPGWCRFQVLLPRSDK